MIRITDDQVKPGKIQDLHLPRPSKGGSLPSREPTLCQIYGHCYCGNQSVNNKPHSVCCACGHRIADVPKFLFPSIMNDQSAARQNPHLLTTVFD